MPLRDCPSCGLEPRMKMRKEKEETFYQVKCTCGWSGPECSGLMARTFAALAWDRRTEDVKYANIEITNEEQYGRNC